MQWPMQPLRDRYLTPFGGTSPDLYPWQVGLNAHALQRNTALVAGARVLVSADGGRASLPLFARRLYELVALDERASPDAAGRSPDGEAVFSAFEVDGDARGQSVLASFTPECDRAPFVVLNAASSQFGQSY